MEKSKKLEKTVVPATKRFKKIVVNHYGAKTGLIFNDLLDDADTVTLTGNVHHRVYSENPTGVAAPSLPMEHMILSLKVHPDNEAAIEALSAKQHDATSSSYQHWLTPEEYGQKFGRSEDELAVVSGWLTKHGFTIDEISKSRSSIMFSGTAAHVRRAFHTTIQEYRVGGKTHHANTEEPSIPRGLADLVDGVVSLHDFPRQAMNSGAQPVSAASSADFTTGTTHYLSPDDFASIYNVNPLYSSGIDGTGQTIAIVGRTHPSPSNWSNFRTQMGLPPNLPQVVIAYGSDPGDQGAAENTEADLDVEWSGAVAKNATIKFVIAKGTYTADGVDLAAQYIVDNAVAPVMSVSFGLCEKDMGSAGNAFYNNLWKRASLQGITVFVSSGDSGAAGCDASNLARGTVAAVSGMSSTPYNVAVGGTKFAEGTGSYWFSSNTASGASAKGYIPEVAWNDSGSTGLWASGGGVSSIYSKPSWQVGSGVLNEGKRGVPDVSLSSSPHDGYFIISGGRTLIAAGTSAAAPSFAGLMSLVVQKTGTAQGNANVRLYELANAQRSGGTAVFHDVMSGNNTVPGVAGQPATVGYDMATGLGSVDATAMVNSWGVAAAQVPLSITAFTLPSFWKSTTVPITSWTTAGSRMVTGYLVTTSADTPAATASGWSLAKPATVTSTVGSKSLYAWIKDSAGTVSSSVMDSVDVDLTIPVVTAFFSAAAVNNANIPVSVTASDDNSGIAGYLVTESATAPALTAAGWSSSAPAGYTAATASGTKTLYAWAKDAAGNISVSKSSITVIDTALPVVNTFAIPSATNSLVVPITAFNASDNLKLAGCLVTDSAAAPAATDSHWSATAPASYSFDQPGLKDLYAWAKDTAGNVSAYKKATVSIDTAAPTVTAFSTPAVVRTLAVPISTFTASDNGTLAGYLITLSSSAPLANATTWSTAKPASFSAPKAGSTTLYAWVKDSVGNVSAPASATVNIDLTAPVVSPFTVTSPVNTLTIPVSSLSASDNTGVTGYLINEVATPPAISAAGWSSTAPSSYSAATAGTKTLYAWAKDAAGNVSAPTKVTGIIDTTLPVLAGFTLPAISKSLTVSGIALSATDNVAVAGYQITEGLSAPASADGNWVATAPTSYTFGPGTADGLKSLYAWARDTSGNVSAYRKMTVAIDTTRPTIVAFSVPDTTNSLTVPVTAFSASDNGTVSGYLITQTPGAPAATATSWSSTRPATFKAAAVGANTLYAWVKDSAGNVSAATSCSTSIDMVAPLLGSFTVRTPVNTLTIPVSALTASDNTGVTGFLVNEVSTAPPVTAAGWSISAPSGYTAATSGAKTLYAWARDAAGNVSLSKTAAAIIDTTMPVLTAFTLPAAVNSLTVPVTTLSATDNVAVGSYQITEHVSAPSANDPNWTTAKPASYTFASETSDGLKILYAWAKDSAGTVSLSKSSTVTIELSLPRIEAFSVPANSNSLTVPITAFTASDSLTSVAGYLITTTATAPLASAMGWSATRPVSFTAPSAGNATLYAWVKNAVGSVSASASATVAIDVIKPIVSKFTVTTPVNSLTVPLSLSASDNTAVTGYLITESAVVPLATAAGWCVTAPDSYTVASAGAKALYAWAKDAAGNVSLALKATVTVPTLRP